MPLQAVGPAGAKLEIECINGNPIKICIFYFLENHNDSPKQIIMTIKVAVVVVITMILVMIFILRDFNKSKQVDTHHNFTLRKYQGVFLFKLHIVILQYGYNKNRRLSAKNYSYRSSF